MAMLIATAIDIIKKSVFWPTKKDITAAANKRYVKGDFNCLIKMWSALMLFDFISFKPCFFWRKIASFFESPAAEDFKISKTSSAFLFVYSEKLISSSLYFNKISVNKNKIYKKIKNSPSFLVIFLPVLIMKIEKIAAATVNILTIKKGEKSTISNGLIRAIIPKIKVEHIITEPIRSPNIIQLRPSLAETIEKYTSGKQLPSPIIRIPTIAKDVPKAKVKKLAVSIITCEAAKSKAKSKTSFIIFFMNKVISHALLLSF